MNSEWWSGGHCGSSDHHCESRQPKLTPLSAYLLHRRLEGITLPGSQGLETLRHYHSLSRQTVIVCVCVFRRKESRSLTSNQREGRSLNRKGKALQDPPTCPVVEKWRDCPFCWVLKPCLIKALCLDRWQTLGLLTYSGSKSPPQPPPPQDWKTCQWREKLLSLDFQNQHAQVSRLLGSDVSEKHDLQGFQPFTPMDKRQPWVRWKWTHAIHPQQAAQIFFCKLCREWASRLNLYCWRNRNVHTRSTHSSVQSQGRCKQATTLELLKKWGRRWGWLGKRLPCKHEDLCSTSLKLMFKKIKKLSMMYSLAISVIGRWRQVDLYSLLVREIHSQNLGDGPWGITTAAVLWPPSADTHTHVHASAYICTPTHMHKQSLLGTRAALAPSHRTTPVTHL